MSATSKFITTLIVHFPIRHDNEAAEKAWLMSMSRSLDAYSAETLEAAAADILATRNDRRFPLPAECRKACEEVEKFKRLAAPKLQEAVKPKYAGMADWETKLADDLIMCPLGEQAAREGWILSLHDYARKHGRVPDNDYAIGECKKGAKEFDDAYELVIRGQGGECNAALEKLGTTMLARRESLRERVLGERG